VDRAGEKIFGILAIIAGVGVVAAVAVGVTITSLVLVIINLVVITWLIYYFTTVRHRGRGEPPWRS
jgi:fatty acid desaturase